MKSIDKFVLVLVASLALLLAGCGGGSSTTEPVDPGPTPEEQQQAAIDKAVADALAAAEAERQAEADRMAAAERAAEMAATAAKLYAGISAPLGNANSPAVTDRAAAYNNAGAAPLGTADTHIVVSIGNGTDTPTAVALSEDKKTTVVAHHGWAGKRYTAEPDDDGMYEAMVYSNVGQPTMGKKFGGAAANDEFEYTLTNGAVTVDTSAEGVPARVALTGVTRTAGTETFKLPESNPGGQTNILVSGSYHGVSGTYSCAPNTPADGCSASVAASGFTLAGGTWTFTPGDANARVTDVPDSAYASYGWWIHKSEDGSTFTASAFVDNKGAVPAATTVTNLQGTATYSGGAAGKYALSSSTGGTNDAGHFTAMATLEADFSDNSITGTVDNFMGADGMSRDWSVELKENMIGAGGHINSDGQAATTTGAQTAWTIGGTAAGASGSWSGTLYDNGDDGVPKVGTGTFYTEYSAGGKMVGAFGVNKD